jgi:hypothetical protein
MAEPSTTSRPREAPAVEAAARIALRRKTAEQRLRIQERLTMGLTVAHIAWVERLDGAVGAADHRGDARQPRDRSAPRLRSIADSPAERSDDCRAHDDDAGQSPGDGSMDQVDERTRPLPGFTPAQIPWARDAAAQPRLAAPEPRAISSNRGVSLAGIAAREGLTAKWSRPEMAPQRLEKIESALGNGMGSEASYPQDVVHGRALIARDSGR